MGKTDEIPTLAFLADYCIAVLGNRNKRGHIITILAKQTETFVQDRFLTASWKRDAPLSISIKPRSGKKRPIACRLCNGRYSGIPAN